MLQPPLLHVKLSWHRPTRVGLLSRAHVPPLLVVALTATTWWLVGYRVAGLNDDFIRALIRNTFGDATGFITAARNLAERGDLTANIIYPASLGFPNLTKDYPYLPGFYAALAASYKLLGFGTIQSLVPSLAGYAIGATSVFFVARKLYGPQVATLSTLIFSLFPANLLFSLVPLKEMALTGAAMLALALFLAIPERRRPLLGPFLVPLPLIFQETGAIVAVPMGMLIVLQRGAWRLKQAAVFALVAAGVMLLVLKSDLSAGRAPSTAAIFRTSWHTLYSDALARQQIRPRLADWPPALASNLTTNVKSVFAAPRYDTSPQSYGPFEIATYCFIVVSIPVGITAGICKRDPFLVGASGAALALFLSFLVATQGGTWDMRGMRVLLLGQPLAAIVFGWGMARLVSSFKNPILRTALLFPPLATLGIFCFWLNGQFFDSQRALTGGNPAFLESLHHDDRFLLTAPFYKMPESFGYLYTHYPVKWAFLPVNMITFEMLNSRYPVGTVILPTDGSTMLDPDSVSRAGFRFEGPRVDDYGVQYLILKRN